MKSNIDKLFIKSSDPHAIIIDGRMFRGNTQLIKKDDSHLLVVNHIELEDYIKGVIYNEASHYWPMEALKAQAIVCRTYALYQMQENSQKDYDVTSDVYSQVYGGRVSERYRTNKAVEDTEGVIITYQGRPFPAYYHATCGGYTEDASVLWNIDISPLKGVACGFCKDSPHFNWHYVLSIDWFKARLADAGYRINSLKDIVIESRDKSGRVTNLKISTDEKDIEIPAKDFRNIVGPNIIRSTNFTVAILNHDIVFEGIGWGHGAGLCQWGAYFMAKAGYKYDEILKHYYPGINIDSLTLNP
jgi:stage II sporulation protein D